MLKDSTKEKAIVLPIFFMPPIAWFAVVLEQSSTIVLEQMEHFPKQTYRNRMEILAANGKLTLSIPMKHVGKSLMKDAEMSFAENWKAQHWKSIQSAYQASPYFEYYQDELKKIFDFPTHSLQEFNLHALSVIFKILKIELNYQLNTEYQLDTHGVDFRNYFSAKKKISWKWEKYYQVFSDKWDFVENLSILDLICNKGPESLTYIKKSLEQNQKELY